MTAVRLVIETNLDEEMLAEIEMMRNLRLDHYRNMASNPENALASLVKSGLTEDVSEVQIISNAIEKANELEARLKEPATIYEEELLMYVQTLDVNTST